MNTLRRHELLREFRASVSPSVTQLLVKYHAASLEAAKADLITAPLDLVPGLQATAQVHQEILNALTAGA